MWKAGFGLGKKADYELTLTEFPNAAGKATYNYEKSDGAEEELPGLSVFYRNEGGEIFHTYSTYARGLDLLVGAYNYLDLTPKGRNEEQIMEWVQLHDQYEQKASSSCCHKG